MREKFGGVIELSEEGGEDGLSQVSERARISMDWSPMNSQRSVGLSRSGVTEVTERALRCANWMKGAQGPGLSSISPARRRRSGMMRDGYRRQRREERCLRFDWMRTETGTFSSMVDSEAQGKVAWSQGGCLEFRSDKRMGLVNRE